MQYYTEELAFCSYWFVKRNYFAQGRRCTFCFCVMDNSVSTPPNGGCLKFPCSIFVFLSMQAKRDTKHTILVAQLVEFFKPELKNILIVLQSFWSTRILVYPAPVSVSCVPNTGLCVRDPPSRVTFIDNLSELCHPTTPLLYSPTIPQPPSYLSLFFFPSPTSNSPFISLSTAFVFEFFSNGGIHLNFYLQEMSIKNAIYFQSNRDQCSVKTLDLLRDIFRCSPVDLCKVTLISTDCQAGRCEYWSGRGREATILWGGERDQLCKQLRCVPIQGQIRDPSLSFGLEPLSAASS